MSQPEWPALSVEELLARARAGEQGALEELFRRSQPQLSRWASQYTGADAPGGTRPSDVVQVSALRAFEKFQAFQGSSEGQWFAWLKRVVFSQAAQLAREALSQKRDDSGNLSLDTQEAEGTPASQPSPSHISASQEEWRQVLAAFFQLTEGQREALSLFHLKGYPAAEVARRMGKSEAAVNSLVQRGAQALAERMAQVRSAEPGDSPEAVAVRNAADAALLVYFRRREAGDIPDPDTFAAEYPLCTEELRRMLHWLERLRALAPPEDA